MSRTVSHNLSVRRSVIADAYNFETFVLELLAFHVARQGKRFEISRPGERDFDGYAPEGFDEFDCPVVIECTISYSRQKFLHEITRVRKLLDLKRSEGQALDRVVLLLVVDRPIDLSEVIPGLRRDDPLLSGLEVVLWPWPKLDELIAKYPEESDRIIDNLLPLRVRNAVRSTTPDRKDDRDGRIRELTERFQTGSFSLFLGAGVSSSAGMPDWNSLLNALFMTYLNGEADDSSASGEETLALVKRMNVLDEPSALVSARYLRKGIAGNSDDRRSFTAAIRDALYGLRSKDKEIASPLIVNLAELCMPRRTGAKVRGVITYNFDDLFERELKRKSIVHRCIYSQSHHADVEELPVYHVHGFIPQETKSYDELDDATLVFAEEGYHQMYTDAYHWSNLVQLNALRESTCLMVGLSMADPNLRRLLEIAQRGVKESRHFAFMKRVSTEAFLATDMGAEEQATVDGETADKFLQRHYALTETLMRELGVTVIWFEHFDEIPIMLSTVGFPTNA